MSERKSETARPVPESVRRRVEAAEDILCGNPETAEPRHFQASWKVAFSILEYFDSYRLGSVAPIAAEIEKAMDAAYQEGASDAR
jgi:hypothetical protein